MKRLLLLSLLSLFSSPLIAQGWGEIQKIVPTDRAQSDNFGYAVAMSGDYAVVGAYRDDSPSGDVGSAYVYKKETNGNWIEHQKLTAPDKRQFDQFGFAVDIDEDYLIVGVRGQDYDASNSNFISSAGAAYIFEKDINDNWNFTQKLVASDRDTTRQLGRCVAISGNYAIVGLDKEDYDVSGENFVQNAGAAYIYERDGNGVWSEVQKIVASERSTFDYFGYNGIDISGNYAVVGAMQEDEDENGINPIPSAGGAYIFEHNGSGTWNEIQKIVASDRAQGDYFGWSIALDGNNLIVGSNQDNNFTGAVYVFEKNGNNIWNEVQKITTSSGLAGDRFGQDMDIDGNRVVIGADRMEIGSISDGGAAFMFEKDGTGIWNETAVMYDPNAKASDYFGFSVAMSGDYSLVGAYQEDEDENNENTIPTAGSAYIFDINEPNTLPPLSTLSVAESDFLTTIRAFPNPIEHILNIDLGNHYQTIHLNIYNVLGQHVFSDDYTDLRKIELNLFDHAKGLYIVELNSENQSIARIKVLKQ